MTGKPYFLRIWQSLVGQKTEFSLEARIFHAVTAIAILTASINMVVNFTIGLILYGFIVVPLLGILGFGYYLSRFKNRLQLAVGIFAVTFNVICGLTYFSSEGSGSVNLFTFILIVFLLSFLCDKRQFKVWIPLTIIHVSILFALEFFNPDLAKPLYSSKQNKLIDITQTWVEVAIMIAVITFFIQNAYRNEKELAKSRLLALTHANDAKNKMFSIVSHDLRAPLATIESYLSVLNQIDLSNEEKKAIEKDLLAATRQTSEMLQNILYWSKDQMLGMNVQLEVLNLFETLKPTLTLQQMLAKEKNLNLQYAIDSSKQVLADQNLLQLIVRNLINNAIKFSHPGGNIFIEAYNEEAKCVIKIADEGKGMDVERNEDIFSIQQQSTQGTNNEKGVGLGLLLSKNYTELQHGKIWFESNSPKGTIFYLSLPIS